MATRKKSDDGFSSTIAFGKPSAKENIDAAPAEDPLVGLQDALAWQYGWTSPIAIAWSDPKMKTELIRDPHRFFKVYTNYILPTGITLKVREMERADKHGHETGWDPANGIWYLQKTELTMYIPTPPPLEQRAVAIAAYVATARAYPFTGC